jgi:hypothetical protein
MGTTKLVLVLAAVMAPKPSVASYLITPFTAPGSADTVASGINATGVVTGTFDGADGILHGFVRDAMGNFTTFDPVSSTATLVFGINNAGVITGSFIDNSGSGDQTGFLRQTNGAFALFNVPGNSGDTIPIGINNLGQISGFFEEGPQQDHTGFIRDAGGAFTIFHVPGTTDTQASGINDFGVVTGEFRDGLGVHGFIRQSDGSFTIFDLPGPVATQEVSQLGINNAGEIVGEFADDQGAVHGFVRSASGIFTQIDAPGALATTVNGINDQGLIVGDFLDSNGNLVGFVADPIPEPATLGLVPASLVFLFVARRRLAAKSKRAGSAAVCEAANI